MKNIRKIEFLNICIVYITILWAMTWIISEEAVLYFEMEELLKIEIRSSTYRCSMPFSFYIHRTIYERRSGTVLSSSVSKRRISRPNPCPTVSMTPYYLLIRPRPRNCDTLRLVRPVSLYYARQRSAIRLIDNWNLHEREGDSCVEAAKNLRVDFTWENSEF